MQWWGIFILKDGDEGVLFFSFFFLSFHSFFLTETLRGLFCRSVWKEGKKYTLLSDTVSVCMAKQGSK